MIERIEELGAEFHFHSFTNGNGLAQSKVVYLDAGSIEDIASAIPESIIIR